MKSSLLSLTFKTLSYLCYYYQLLIIHTGLCFEFLFTADSFHFYLFVQPGFLEQFFLFFQAAFRNFYLGVFVNPLECTFINVFQLFGFYGNLL